MVEVRDEIEPYIWWQLKAGTSSFWFDNWTSLGALYFIVEEQVEEEEFEVRNLIEKGQRLESDVRNPVSDEIATHILKEIKPAINDTNDKPWWTDNSPGLFTVKSAYQILRRRNQVVDWFSTLWMNRLPYKINFCIWRVMHKRISTDDILRGMGIPIVCKCFCCDTGRMESLNHIFLTAPLAQKLWGMFVQCAGFNQTGMMDSRKIQDWWAFTKTLRGKRILNAVPAILIWELWKYRNSIRHGKLTSLYVMQKNCLMTIRLLMKSSYPGLNIPNGWVECFDLLQKLRPNLLCKVINWVKPTEGWIKCNTDGSSKGNPALVPMVSVFGIVMGT